MLALHLQRSFCCCSPSEYICLMLYQYHYVQAILESPLTRHRWHTTDWRSYGADRGNVSFLDHSFPVARKSVELRNWASADVPLDQHRHNPGSFVFTFLYPYKAAFRTEEQVGVSDSWRLFFHPSELSFVCPLRVVCTTV